MTGSSRRDVPATVTATVPAPAACADVAGPLLENAVTGVLITGALWGLLVAAGAAQAPVDQVDAHVAAARAAAGPDYRATFVNLCLPAAPRGAGAVQRYFTVMAECAMASRLRLGAK